MNTTYAEAMASKPSPIKAHPGFATVAYSPTVGLSPRRRTITVLLYKGVAVDRGSASDQRALLGNAATKARWIAAARA